MWLRVEVVHAPARAQGVLAQRVVLQRFATLARTHKPRMGVRWGLRSAMLPDICARERGIRQDANIQTGIGFAGAGVICTWPRATGRGVRPCAVAVSHPVKGARGRGSGARKGRETSASGGRAGAVLQDAPGGPLRVRDARLLHLAVALPLPPFGRNGRSVRGRVARWFAWWRVHQGSAGAPMGCRGTSYFYAGATWRYLSIAEDYVAHRGIQGSTKTGAKISSENTR